MQLQNLDKFNLEDNINVNKNNYNSNFNQINSQQNKKSGKWSIEEDNKLSQIVGLYGEKSWRKISECMEGRSPIQCLHRWTKILKPGLVKGPWTSDEDQMLIDWVNEEGPTKWALASKIIRGRSGKQCRERWFNNLCPNVKKGQWEPEEDKLIFELYQKFGTSWCKIAKQLPGRTENSIKNRFYSTIRKIASDKQKSKIETVKAEPDIKYLENQQIRENVIKQEDNQEIKQNSNQCHNDYLSISNNNFQNSQLEERVSNEINQNSAHSIQVQSKNEFENKESIQQNNFSSLYLLMQNEKVIQQSIIEKESSKINQKKSYKKYSKKNNHRVIFENEHEQSIFKNGTYKHFENQQETDNQNQKFQNLLRYLQIIMNACKEQHSITSSQQNLENLQNQIISFCNENLEKIQKQESRNYKFPTYQQNLPINFGNTQSQNSIGNLFLEPQTWILKHPQYKLTPTINEQQKQVIPPLYQLDQPAYENHQEDMNQNIIQQNKIVQQIFQQTKLMMNQQSNHQIDQEMKMNYLIQQLQCLEDMLQNVRSQYSQLEQKNSISKGIKEENEQIPQQNQNNFNIQQELDQLGIDFSDLNQNDVIVNPFLSFISNQLNQFKQQKDQSS